MKFEAGKTYKTRGGDDAYIYAVDAPGPYPIHGRVLGHEEGWARDGQYFAGSRLSDHLDLTLPAPPRISQTVWVNVHKDSLIIYTSKSHANLTDPDFTIRHAVPCRLEEIVE